MLNEDYKEMVQILLDNEVRFLVVGAYAMGAHGYPRATGDLDIWVEADKTNSRKLYDALVQFGSPVSQLNKDTFCEHGIVFQIGVAPRRIDILTHIDGVDFDQAYESKEIVELEGLSIPFLSKENLIKNKRATGRQRDKLDADNLEVLNT